MGRTTGTSKKKGKNTTNTQEPKALDPDGSTRKSKKQKQGSRPVLLKDLNPDD
jgi:hypothetical protein